MLDWSQCRYGKVQKSSLRLGFDTWTAQPVVSCYTDGAIEGHNCNYINITIDLIKKTTRCKRVVEFIIPVFLNCSTCFRRHTAHYQGLKNCNCSLWFYVRLWLPVAMMAQALQAAITVFELLMMGGVSPETYWAIKKHWNNKFYYAVASCWLFL